MIVIQSFPSVAALRGWLHNARYRCKDQYSFTQWLSKYLSTGRELTACGQVYDYRACMELLQQAGGLIRGLFYAIIRKKRRLFL